MAHDAKVVERYLNRVIERVENSEISNAGKDEGGFFLPRKAVVIQRLSMMRDLQAGSINPHSLERISHAWEYIVQNLPPELLMIEADEKVEIKSLLRKA